LQLTFDTSLNMTGGEDTLFFRQLVHRGGKMVYAAAATAMETIPESRRTVRYILWRHLRWGATLSFCDRVISGTPGAIAHRVMKAMAHAVLGIIMLLPAYVWRGKAGSVLALCRIARGSGMILGLIGLGVQSYQRVEVNPSQESRSGGNRRGSSRLIRL
jgi:succinoglycan biosynthesis protein ExoM